MLEFSHGQHQDPTWREREREKYVRNLNAAVLDRNPRSPPQVWYDSPQYHLGPGTFIRTPKVCDDKELGLQISATFFFAEYLIEGNGNKRELRVSYERYNFLFLSSKSSSAPEDVPSKGITQASKHEYHGLHMPYLSSSSPRWDNLPSGHQRYRLKGINLGYMYWGQKHSSE